LIVKELQICRMWMFHHCRNCRRYASWLARSFRQPFHLMRHCRLLQFCHYSSLSTVCPLRSSELQFDTVSDIVYL